MKVKKYVAASMPEAMKKIRAELGNDVVILNSKVIHTGGFLGFFKKRNIEVIAAVDSQTAVDQQPVVKEKMKSVPFKNQESFNVIKEEVPVKTNVTKNQPPEELLKEISELKALMQKMSSNNSSEGMSYPDVIAEVRLILSDQEINADITQKALSELLEKWYVHGAKASKEEVLGWLNDFLGKRMDGIPFGGITFTKKYVNVVGPTGVGKTTTLAKIAADCVLKYKKKVAFITTDTYRIAAIDQLKTYAKILNVPLEVCYSLEDFKKATEKFEAYDTVLIDTAGRNFRNQKYVEDLKKVIDFDGNMETFLVLSLTSKQRDMEDIYKQFSLIGIHKFIFTKADETSNYGAMLNLVDKYQKGIGYLTYGQNVPDDMIAAEPKVITNTILGVEKYDRSS